MQDRSGTLEGIVGNPWLCWNHLVMKTLVSKVNVPGRGWGRGDPRKLVSTDMGQAW